MSQTIQFLSSTNTAWSFKPVLLHTHIEEYRNRWNAHGVHSGTFKVSALGVRGIRTPMHRLGKENLPGVLLQSCVRFSWLLRNTGLVTIKSDYFDLKKGITSKATYYERVLALSKSRRNFFTFWVSLLSTLLCLSLKIQNKFNNH